MQHVSERVSCQDRGPTRSPDSAPSSPDLLLPSMMVEHVMAAIHIAETPGAPHIVPCSSFRVH
jgi:hypothetical protein